jgi:hypothetical protein
VLEVPLGAPGGLVVHPLVGFGHQHALTHSLHH